MRRGFIMQTLWRSRLAGRVPTLACLVASTAIGFARVGAQTAPPAPSTARALPTQISDSAFWRMFTDFSEPGGFFRSDNFVSNETSFQYVIPELQRIGGTGGVYLGVAPDQNFTYLVALEPKVAFIVDIRRQNALQHLLYKALIELSADRAEFVSRLFSRPRPPGVDSTSTANALLEAYDPIAPDSALFDATFAAVADRLTRRHGFALSAEDLETIEYVFDAFFTAGPAITYSYPRGQVTVRFPTGMVLRDSAGVWIRIGSDSVRMRGTGRDTAGIATAYRLRPAQISSISSRGMPTYAQLILETDGAGVQHSYLASERNYRILKDLQIRNLVIPLVGDFAGPHALRSVAQYLKEHGSTVTAFYTSNVEQYLFRQRDDWRRFYENVATLPIDENSLFIRSLSNGAGFRPGSPNSRSVQLLSSIAELLRAFEEGRVLAYNDVIQLSK